MPMQGFFYIRRPAVSDTITRNQTDLIHYAAFACSRDLRLAGEHLVYAIEHEDNWKQHEVLLEILHRFDQEWAQSFVIDALQAMGIGDRTERMARKGVDTLSNTSYKLAKQLVPKLGAKEMTLASAHIKSLALTLPHPEETWKPYTGFAAPQQLQSLRLSIVDEIRAGNGPSQHKNLTLLLNQLADLMLENFYMKSIRLMNLGFIPMKLIQGGMVLGRGVQHQLISWVVPSLDQPAMERMADYMDQLTLSVETPPPFRYLYHPKAV